MKIQVKETVEKPPAIKNCQLIIACMCGLEIASVTDVDTEFVAKAGRFYSYCLTDLHLAKREIPRTLTQKIDKSVQDSFKILLHFALTYLLAYFGGFPNIVTLRRTLDLSYFGELNDVSIHHLIPWPLCSNQRHNQEAKQKAAQPTEAAQMPPPASAKGALVAKRQADKPPKVEKPAKNQKK